MKNSPLLLVFFLFAALFFMESCNVNNSDSTIKNSTVSSASSSSLSSSSKSSLSSPVIQYTITYNLNGGTSGAVPASTVYASGTVVTVSSNSGFLFKKDSTGELFKLGSWNTLANGTGTSYTAGTGTFTINSNITLYAQYTAFSITDNGPAGGYIFYDKGSYSSGWRYMEASSNPYQYFVLWDTGTNVFTYATGTAVGTGASNTAKIVAAQGGGTYAASVCNDYIATNGNEVYEDWFLPSKDELSYIYTNLYLNKTGNYNQGLPFWTSSEATVMGTQSYKYAWELYLYNGVAAEDSSKTYYFYAVPVRMF
jgi:hypothetical protein